MSSIKIEKNPGVFDLLLGIRARCGGATQTPGLDDNIVHDFLANDSALAIAIEEAAKAFEQLRSELPDFIALTEAQQIEELLQGFTNFYADDAITPFVPLAARGPWLITTKGAVIHDNGGYGMLGFGHAPPSVLAAISKPHVMANIMTPNLMMGRFIKAMNKELGHRHSKGNPFKRFLCLNSGSESVTLAARIADVNSKIMTDAGGRYEGREICILSIGGAFHGRTDRPARFSDSSLKVYKQHLASFREHRLLTVPPNDIEALEDVFAQANRDKVFIEAFFVEPVMGEGNPGMAITREFYDRARTLTKMHGSMLLVDSIQAGLRAQGCLSIIDYPGFEDCDPPDMETYSKALNAGQYPLSVLALTEEAAALYRKGIYGNTMTTNPRCLDAACEAMALLTDDLRENIRARGAELRDKLKDLGRELDDAMFKVQGTGLLVSGELDPGKYKAYGANSTEEYIRKRGVNVIHGGKNALRFTPYFGITSREIDLLVAAVKDALINGPVITD
ncbi:MAG: aminotransferase class III-fold pyridoxal phosphate-dependent enzyme [Gammaproteobacteria bacterium]|nr:aminotransferase class III-fold pyridoxal phosphate-dependent enzyme [Gammaproteobacteria bacterium]